MLVSKAGDIWKQEHLSGLRWFAHIESMGNPLCPALRTECTAGKPWCKLLHIRTALGRIPQIHVPKTRSGTAQLIPDLGAGQCSPWTPIDRKSFRFVTVSFCHLNSDSESIKFNGHSHALWPLSLFWKEPFEEQDSQNVYVLAVPFKTWNVFTDFLNEIKKGRGAFE